MKKLFALFFAAVLAVLALPNYAQVDQTMTVATFAVPDLVADATAPAKVIAAKAAAVALSCPPVQRDTLVSVSVEPGVAHSPVPIRLLLHGKAAVHRQPATYVRS